MIVKRDASVKQNLPIRIEAVESLPMMDGGAQKIIDDPFLKEIASRLAYLREIQRRISPEELSEKIRAKGFDLGSPSYIRRLEKAQNWPTTEMLSAILEALGTTFGEFFEFTVKEEPAKDRVLHRAVQRILGSSHRRALEVVIEALDENQGKP